MFLASESDSVEELKLPVSLFKKHTSIKLYSNLIDSHIYVLKNCMIKYLKSETSFMSLKGEFLPYIIKKQLSKPPKPMDTKESLVNVSDTGDIFSFVKEDELDLAVREASAYNDHIGDLKPAYHGDMIRCYAYIAPNDSIGTRVNTLQSFWSLNGKVSGFRLSILSFNTKLVIVDYGYLGKGYWWCQFSDAGPRSYYRLKSTG